MIWVFRDLNTWITAETGIPCLLPGQPDTDHAPHVDYNVRKVTFDVPAFGTVEHDEKISAGSKDQRYRGPAVCAIEMDLNLSAFGSSPDFAFTFFQALRSLQKLIKVGIVNVPFVTQQRGPAKGAGLVVNDSAVVSDFDKVNGVDGTWWVAGFDCVLIFPQRDDDDYTVDPIVYETEPSDGPVPIG